MCVVGFDVQKLKSAYQESMALEKDDIASETDDEVEGCT